MRAECKKTCRGNVMIATAGLGFVEDYSDSYISSNAPAFLES